MLGCLQLAERYFCPVLFEALLVMLGLEISAHTVIDQD